MMVRAGVRNLAASLIAALAGASALLAACSPAAAALILAPSAPPPSTALKVLSPGDARAYAAAFQAARHGDAAAADRAALGVADPCLLPLLHARPGSTLALNQRALRRGEALAARGSSKFGAGRYAAAVAAPGQAARDAFYHGDPSQAYALATASGERWIAGLSAYRLRRFVEAGERFAALSADATQNDWVRSGAAFWAARAMVAAGQPARAPAFLQMAARTPYTFYGLIAERQLGIDPAVTGHGISYAAMMAKAGGAPAVSVPAAALARLVASDPRAHRAAAFAQLGMGGEAETELRAAALSSGGAERPAWAALAQALGVHVATPRNFNPSDAFRFDLADFPIPALDPKGGFTLDKALVYALVRQESRFNPAAVSGSGAYGLMQLTAATAARMAGESRSRSPAYLRDAAINLRLGQDYMADLLGIVQGDLLRAVAAYNGGPGILSKLYARMGERPTDSLMVIESMPAAQTRDYVQRVLAGYWIYRELFGKDSRTLDAVAAGAGRIAANLDR